MKGQLYNKASGRATWEKGRWVFIQSHDITATILALLGIEHHTEGINTWPIATGDADSIRDHVVIGWADWSNGPARGYASVRDDEWNNTVDVGQEEINPKLYYLPDDPEERENVIADFPAVGEKQRKRLEAVLGQGLTA